MQILAGKDDGAQVRGLLGASVNRNQMSKATCGGSPCAEHSRKFLSASRTIWKSQG